MILKNKHARTKHLATITQKIFKYINLEYVYNFHYFERHFYFDKRHFLTNHYILNNIMLK